MDERYQVHLSIRERDILADIRNMQGSRQITLGNELRDYFGKAALYSLSRERSHHRSRNRSSLNTYYILIMSSLLTKATKHLPMYFYTLIYFVNIIHYVTIYCYTMSKSTQIHIISHHYHFYYMNFDITSRKLYVSLISAVSSWCSIIHFSSNSSSKLSRLFLFTCKTCRYVIT